MAYKYIRLSAVEVLSEHKQVVTKFRLVTRGNTVRRRKKTWLEALLKSLNTTLPWSC